MTSLSYKEIGRGMGESMQRRQDEHWTIQLSAMSSGKKCPCGKQYRRWEWFRKHVNQTEHWRMWL